MRVAACIGTIVLGLLFAADPAMSQRAAPGSSTPSAGGSASSAEERAAQLRAVVGLVTTPDRDLNIANFEQIVESGDARRIEIAVRSMLGSDDPVIRGIALRGYALAAGSLELEVVLPQAELRIVEQARAQPNGLSNISAPNQHLSVLSRNQFRVKLWFGRGDVKGMRGEIKSVEGDTTDRDYRNEYTVRGERITFRLWPFHGAGASCDFEIEPKKDATISGTMACRDARFPRPVQLVGSMF